MTEEQSPERGRIVTLPAVMITINDLMRKAFLDWLREQRERCGSDYAGILANVEAGDWTDETLEYLQRFLLHSGGRFTHCDNGIYCWWEPFDPMMAFRRWVAEPTESTDIPF